MKTIAQNYAADLLRADTGAAPAPLMLEAIACDLRTLYGEAADEMPERLIALARRLDRATPDPVARAS